MNINLKGVSYKEKKINFVDHLSLNEYDNFQEKLLKYYDNISCINPDADTLREMIQVIKKLNKDNYKYLYLKENNLIKGFVMFTDDCDQKFDEKPVDYRVSVLFIFPKYRGNGLGTKLMKQLEKYLKGKFIYLIPTTYDLNWFYSRIGYETYNGYYMAKQFK